MEAVEPSQMLAGRLKLATGAAFTVMFCVADAEQDPEFTDNEMVFAPAVAQLTVCGPTPVAVSGLAPAPKFQV